MTSDHDAPSAPGGRPRAAALARRGVRLAIWAFAVWLLLTWTVPAEQLVFGAVLALAVAAALSPVTAAVAPWRLLDPRVLGALLAVIATSLARVVRANVGLAARIWAPGRPLHSGMVIVPTTARTPAELGVTGLITSLIVDNQIVDLDTERKELQYHAIAVPPGDPAERAQSINAPTERSLARVDRR